jgi:hypothetical protein
MQESHALLQVWHSAPPSGGRFPPKHVGIPLLQVTQALRQATHADAGSFASLWISHIRPHYLSQ